MQARFPASASDSDSRVITNLEDCVVSAQRMVSSAASIVSARSVRAGSDLGEALSEEQRTRIEKWILPPTIPEDVGEGDEPANPEDEGNEKGAPHQCFHRISPPLLAQSLFPS
jgi:hypothetical protein